MKAFTSRDSLSALQMRSSKRELMYRKINKNRIGAIGKMYLNFGFLQICQLVVSLWYIV